MKLGLVIPSLTQHRLALEAVESFHSRYDVEFFPICNWRLGYSVAQSWNYGIHKAMFKGCGLIFVANDDILISRSAVDRMVITMFEHRDLAVLTGKDYRDEVGPDHIREYNPSIGFSYKDRITDYAFYVIRPSAFADIGQFDTTFTPAYFEDNDYHYRILISDSWKTAQDKSAAFYHYGSTTQNEGGKKICSSPQFEANRSYYIKKWGGVPGNEKFTEPFGGQVIDSGITI